jgi:hypothetical protein
MNPSHLADISLLVVYGAVAAFFASRALDGRRLLARRLASVGVALLPMGWILLAAWDLGLWAPGSSGLVRWFGVGFGLFLLTRVRVTQRKGTDE